MVLTALCETASMADTVQVFSEPPEPLRQAESPKEDPSVEEQVQRFEEKAQKDANIVAQVRTIFPFKLFPTTLYVDRTKLTIDEQYFFFSHECKTVLLPDIMTITIETNLFFATLKIEDRLAPINVATVRFLPKQQAERFRQIAEGLRMGIHDNIDLTKVPREILADRAERIGGVQGTPPVQ